MMPFWDALYRCYHRKSNSTDRIRNSKFLNETLRQFQDSLLESVREQITKNINKIMALVSKNLPVKQVIGDSKLDTTPSYVQDLSEKKRQDPVTLFG